MNLEHQEMNIMRGRFKLTLISIGVLILVVSGAVIIGTVNTRTNASVTTHIKPRLEPTPVSTLAEPEPSRASIWLKPQGSAVVVDSLVQADRNNALDAPQGRPLEQGKAQQAAQRELIELGFGTIEGEQFQAYVAEADDAGYGELLLQVGFTEQQIRHAGFTEEQVQDARRGITSNELSGDIRTREEQRIADHQADLQDMLRYWDQLKQDGEMGTVP